MLTPTAELAHQVSRHFARLSEGSDLKSLVLSKVGGDVGCSVTANSHGSYQQGRKGGLFGRHTTTPHFNHRFEADRFLWCGNAHSGRRRQTIRGQLRGTGSLVISSRGQIDAILAACTNAHLQRLLFSATLPSVFSPQLLTHREWKTSHEPFFAILFEWWSACVMPVTRTSIKNYSTVETKMGSYLHCGIFSARSYLFLLLTPRVFSHPC